MPDALDKLRAGLDKAHNKLAANRLGGREWDVFVIPQVKGDRSLGTKGGDGAPVKLDPRPAVRFRAVYSMTDDGLMQVGDCRVTSISRAKYTLQDLKGPEGGPAHVWQIDGRRYTFVDAEAKPTEWQVTLQREGEN